MRSTCGGGSDDASDGHGTATQEPVDWHTPESLRSEDDESDADGIEDAENDHHSSTHGSSSGSSSPRYSKPKPRKAILLATQHLESNHTIQQHKNLLKSIETEFNANLTGHIWSAILIKRKQREREERLRSGLPVNSSEDSDEDSDDYRPPKRRRGRPRLSGPDYTTDKLVTKSWTSWPLPYGELPPIPPSTTVAASSHPTPPPHPLEEAITALFLRQSTEALRSANLPVSADDTVSTHMLKPIVGGILAKLDKLLLAVYESNNAGLREHSKKAAKGRMYRKIPLGWSGVLGLAGLTGWDEGWGTGLAKGEGQNSITDTTKLGLGPVGRATQKMCTELGEGMHWRAWPYGSSDITSSIPYSFPIQSPEVALDRHLPPQTPPLTSAGQSPHDSPQVPQLSSYHHTRLRHGVDNDGFLEMIPTIADHEPRNLRIIAQDPNHNKSIFVNGKDNSLQPEAASEKSSKDERDDETEDGETTDTETETSDDSNESGEESLD